MALSCAWLEREFETGFLPHVKGIIIDMALSCAWLEREFETGYIGHLVLLPFSSLAECFIYEVGRVFQYRV
jgi:hypothetical protein